MYVRIINGDCRNVLKTLPDESIHCVITSPPYWNLRDYGIENQIGLESDLQQYIEELISVFREVKRVLRKDGILWLNLGDCYAGPRNGKSNFNQDFNERSGNSAGQRKQELAVIEGLVKRDIPIGLKPKDLCGMPWRVAFALQADGWWLRQDIIWSKVNAMPESITDRCTKAHEYMFLLSKSTKYYFDNEAIKENSTASIKSKLRYEYGRYEGNGNANRFIRSGKPDFLTKKGNDFGTNTPIITSDRKDLRSNIESRHRSSIIGGQSLQVNPDGKRNKRSVWEIPTAPFSEAHFATFPPKLIEPCILAGCPKGGIVLDPFGGACTTGLVANSLGRNSILIELNSKYIEIGIKRIKDKSPLLFKPEIILD